MGRPEPPSRWGVENVAGRRGLEVRSEGHCRSQARNVARRVRRRRRRLLVDAVAFALVTTACGGSVPHPETDAEPQTSASRTTAIDSLVDRVWMRTDSDAPPGDMRIFLSDGVLVMDSCWEVYRLERWSSEDGRTVRWTEDGVEISGVARVDGVGLELRLDLVSGPVVQSYTPAAIPYLCPEVPR